MEKLTCYVIYASEKIERLSHFLQCASDSHVVPISAVTKEQVSLLGKTSFSMLSIMLINTLITELSNYSAMVKLLLVNAYTKLVMSLMH